MSMFRGPRRVDLGALVARELRAKVPISKILKLIWRSKMILQFHLSFRDQTLTMYSLYLLLLLLFPYLLCALIKEITFTPVTFDSPWAPRIRAQWQLILNPSRPGDSPQPVFYGGWSPLTHSRLFNLQRAPDFSDAWLQLPNQSWVPFHIDRCLQLYVQCPGQNQIWSRGRILQPSGVTDLNLQWQAWRTLITRRLDSWERDTCLSQGQARYYLHACTRQEDFTSSNLLSSEALIDSWPLNMSVPRYGVLTATHYNNIYLDHDDIYYLLGGGIPQPDGGDYELKGLWASRDGGHRWTQVNAGWWTHSTDQMSLGISSTGVMVMSMSDFYHEELWISLDGGEHWDTCTEHAEWGRRSGATLGFDAQGYLYVMGGVKHDTSVAEIFRSNISFDNFDQVREHCGWVDLPVGGVPGLAAWKTWMEEAKVRRMAPQMG